MAGVLAATAAALFAAAGFLVHRGPRAPFGFVFGHAAMFVALFDVFSLPLFLAV
jgi:hypothetical protein